VKTLSGRDNGKRDEREGFFNVKKMRSIFSEGRAG